MRARNLKPGFFKNEDLAEISPPWGRILFEGLWCLADREGRLLDRPGFIAVEIFPYDIAKGRLTIPQVEEMLSELEIASEPFIFRYEVNGRKFIQILKFHKHNSPHATEKASEIPPYQEIKSRKKNPKLTVNPPKSNGESTVNPPKSNGENPPDSLNPDSLNHRITEVDATPPQPPDGGNGDARPLPVFSCSHFQIDQAFFDELIQEYPGLSPELLKREINKAAGWLTDNPGKHKRRAKTGFIANPRTFLRNWLDKVTIPGSGQARAPTGRPEPKGFAALRSYAEKRGVKEDAG